MSKPGLGRVFKLQLLLAGFALLPNLAFSQSANPVPELERQVSLLNEKAKSAQEEDVFLRFDKSFYATGDTVWFQATLLNRADHTPSQKSVKLYVEFINDSSRLVSQHVIPLKYGLGGGFIPVPTKLRPGIYGVRAYTNWMQNRGEDYFFYRSIQVGGTDNSSWLVRYTTHHPANSSSNAISLDLQLSDLAQRPLSLRPVEVKILDDDHSFVKSTQSTSVDGTLSLQVSPPKGGTGRLSVTVQDKQDNRGHRLSFPVYAGLDHDVQFLPESGYLVAGLYNKLAVKILNDHGLGANAQGIVLDSKQQQVASFATTHAGMGSFYLKPLAGESYTAKLTFSSGDSKTTALPGVKASGTVLHVNAVPGSDSLFVSVNASQGFSPSGDSYSLIGQTRGTVYYAAAFTLDKGVVKVKIPKASFPGGIAHFLLIGPGDRTLNERLVFVSPINQLDLSLVPSKQKFRVSDSVAVDIRATSASGTPVSGVFTVSVTDDSQVRSDSLENNLLTHFLLTSELKGNVESPYWYFKKNDPETTEALDNLLLAQGWVTYDWDKKTEPSRKPTFEAESDFNVTGTLSNLLNKPAAGRKVTLMAPKAFLFMDTLSNAEGRFTFDNLPVTDSMAYFIQVKKPNDKSSPAGLKLQEFTPATPRFRPSAVLDPWFVSPDTLLRNYLQTAPRQQRYLADLDTLRGNVMNEIVLSAKKTIEDPETGQEEKITFSLDQKTFEHDNEMSLLDLFELRLKGFQRTTFRVDGLPIFGVYVDKQPVTRKQIITFLKTTKAKDILKLETYSKWISRAGRPPVLVSIVMITSRGGVGPYMPTLYGSYVYRPLPIQKPTNFYRPRYTAEKTSNRDLRSTLHWEPLLVTDDSGKSGFSFFTASRPGTYTLLLEGTDLTGAFGFETLKIKIDP